MVLEKPKVLIGCQDGKVETFSDSANEEIGIGTLYALPPTEVDHFGSPLVIAGCDFQIREGPQGVAQGIVLSLFADAGEDFLSDGADDLGARFVYQFT